MTAIIFPWNPLRERGYDEEFQKEVDAIRYSDLMSFSIDHDGLTSDIFRTWNTPAEPTTATYRGWMVTPEQYALMYTGLESKNITLATTPEQYSTAHHINGWMKALEGLTFKTVLLPLDPADEDILAAAAELDAEGFFVKDFVKSLKTSEGFTSVPFDGLVAAVREFQDERGDWLAGGIVIREFVDLPADRVEMRGWWVEGEWKAITVHPDYANSDPAAVPEELLSEVSSRLTELGLRFVTADFTATSSGDWKVIEIGDGQVSGFPDSVDDETILKVLS